MPGPWQIVPHPKIILVKVIGSEREGRGMDRQTDMEGGDQDTSWEEKHQKLEGDKKLAMRSEYGQNVNTCIKML